MRHISKLVALTLVVAASLWQVGCDKEVQESSQQKQIKEMSSILNQQQLNADELILTIRGNEAEFGKLSSEEEEALRMVVDNPELGFEAVTQEVQGQDKLDALEAILKEKSALEIKEELSTFVPDTLLNVFDNSVNLNKYGAIDGKAISNKLASLNDVVVTYEYASIGFCSASIAALFVKGLFSRIAVRIIQAAGFLLAMRNFVALRMYSKNTYQNGNVSFMVDSRGFAEDLAKYLIAVSEVGLSKRYIVGASFFVVGLTVTFIDFCRNNRNECDAIIKDNKVPRDSTTVATSLKRL